MKYSVIKDTGTRIPRIIFGTSALGNLYRALNHETKLSIVRESLLSVDGPVVFDSAGKYGAGLALEELGKNLGLLDADPEKVIISNKLGWYRTDLRGDEPGFEKGVWIDIHHDARQMISAKGILSCYEQGIHLLGGRYRPRLLSVHDPDEYLAAAGKDPGLRAKLYSDIIDAYKSLFELNRPGGSIAIGVGAKDWKVIREISADIDLDWVMIANSMTLFSHPRELTTFMTEIYQKGVTVINSALFNAGFLTGGRFFNYRPAEPGDPEFSRHFKWRESFFEICNEFSITPSHACIQFGLSHPAVSAAALNTSDPGHVRRNIEEIERPVPEGFFRKMKERGLIDEEYPYV